MSIHKTHRTGVVNELKVAAWYVAAGWETFLPAMAQSHTDLVAIKGDKIEKVQVKTARDCGGYVKCDLGYSKKELFTRLVVCHPDGRVWSIPESAIDITKDSLMLGGAKKNYKGWNPNRYLVRGPSQWSIG